ncbi:exodeoxyribonuclease VII small subunit [bacterium]|nr:exodeoxyribonuclease VII small subunit [bacterium]
MAKSKKTPDFEQSLEQLESLVEALEAGDLTLEQSLKQFEEGITLTRACQTALGEAEQTVKMLTEKSGQPTLEDLDIDAADD